MNRSACLIVLRAERAKGDAGSSSAPRQRPARVHSHMAAQGANQGGLAGAGAARTQGDA